ncbi:MAG: hypothetical protein ACXADH_16055 [Candidatus Kariarchaeaceae archaeon]|jgi:hypothetical protein
MKIKINKKQALNELTEEEYEFVKEALEIPPTELPFSNIFGDKYRILGNFEVVTDKHPLSKVIKFLTDNGWTFNTPNPPKEFSFTKTYDEVAVDRNDRTKLDKNVKSVTKTFGLQKLMQDMNKAMTQSMPNSFADYEKLREEAKELNKSFLAAEGEEQEKLANQIQINLYRQALGKRLRAGLAEHMPLFADQAALFDMQKSIDKLFAPAFVIFSRHPIDVFRMSDFTQITSCHSPPSIKGDEKFDQFNICALAEAYANGMISYVVTAEEFKKKDMEPTQETLDEYEDDELFYDAERGEGVLEPRSRIRIRRTAYTDPDTNNVTPLAVPDQKVYGLNTGGFKEYVRDYIANIQKADLEKIFQTEVEGFQDGSTLLSIDNFERFGGSYEDNGMAVRDNLPMMFASALDIDPLKIIASGYLKYDRSLQNELESRADEEFGASIEDVERDVEVWAEQASRRQAWYFDVEVGEINGIPSIDEVGLIVYVTLPEDVDVANNFSKINSIFEDYKDYFSLPWANFDQVEPEEIAVYAAGNIDDSNFSSPFVRIRYPDLQFMAREATGESFRLDNLEEQLNQLTESSRDGGMSIALATDPYVEDGFDKIATTILGVTGFVDDSDFYLQQVANEYAVQQYKEWDEQNESYDYIGPFEIQTDVTYTSTLSIDLSVLQERGGYTPKQAATLLIMLGQDEALQRYLVAEINKECQIAAGDADSWNGIIIPFTITGPDNYSSVEEIFEDDPDGQVDDSFDLRMELDQDDVRLKSEKVALAALLEQYDEAEMGELILAFSEPLKAKMRELVPAEPTNENKKRMKVRMIRG